MEYNVDARVHYLCLLCEQALIKCINQMSMSTWGSSPIIRNKYMRTLKLDTPLHHAA